MPQTTIYVSPRSLGAPDQRPPSVATTDLARLFAGSPALAGVSLRVEAARTDRAARGERRRQDDPAAPAGDRHPPVVRPRRAWTAWTSTATPPSSASASPTSRTPPACTTTSRRARTCASPPPCSARRTPTARVERALADVGARRPGRGPGARLLGRHAQAAGAGPHPARPAVARAPRRAVRRARRATAWRIVDQLLAAWREAGVSILVASHPRTGSRRYLDGTRRARARRWWRRSAARACASLPVGPAGATDPRGGGYPMSALRGRGANRRWRSRARTRVAELRGRHATVSTLFFAAVVLLLFGFALGPDSARLAAAAPGPAVAGGRLRRPAGGEPAPPARDR